MDGWKELLAYTRCPWLRPLEFRCCLPKTHTLCWGFLFFTGNVVFGNFSCFKCRLLFSYLKIKHAKIFIHVQNLNYLKRKLKKTQSLKFIWKEKKTIKYEINIKYLDNLIAVKYVSRENNFFYFSLFFF